MTLDTLDPGLDDETWNLRPDGRFRLPVARGGGWEKRGAAPPHEPAAVPASPSEEPSASCVPAPAAPSLRDLLFPDAPRRASPDPASEAPPVPAPVAESRVAAEPLPEPPPEPAPPSEAGDQSPSGPFIGRMTTLIAWRNLRQDPVRFAATLVGIVFSVTLMTVQIGLLSGFAKTASGLVDRSGVDIWITSKGTSNVDQSVILPERNVYKALEIEGVANAARVTVRFVDWRKRNGSSELVILVGSAVSAGMALPWNLDGVEPARLNEPDAIVVDRLYAPRLGVTEVGQEVEIRGRRARVIGFTNGVRTFTQAPYVFTSYNNSLKYNDVRDGDASYVAIRLRPGADEAAVVSELKRSVREADVLTSAEFSRKTQTFWIYSTGAGLSLGLGALLSALVGFTIVAQTLYAATIERLTDYATLAAMGAPKRYLNAIVVKKAAIAGALGVLCGFVIVGIIHLAIRNGPVFLRLTPELLLGIGAFTLVMCVAASLLAVGKLMRVDPTSVFK